MTKIYKIVLRTNTASIPEFEHVFQIGNAQMASEYVAVLIRNHLSRTVWFYYASLFEIIEHSATKTTPAMVEQRHINDFYPKYGVGTLREQEQ